jgi:hypothetical protein
VRFGLVTYRDHPPQDTSYVTQVFPFTSDIMTATANVSTMVASGGGDGPEALADAMLNVRDMPYRPGASKICIWIADAPPHGIEPRGDGFPDGCPCGHDPIALAIDCLRRGITIYTVGCEANLQAYVSAFHFLIAVAEITQGQALGLANVDLLARVVVGGAQEELGLALLKDRVEAWMAELGEGFSVDNYTKHVMERLKVALPDARMSRLVTDAPEVSRWRPPLISGYSHAPCRGPVMLVSADRSPRTRRDHGGLSIPPSCPGYPPHRVSGRVPVHSGDRRHGWATWSGRCRGRYPGWRRGPREGLTPEARLRPGHRRQCRGGRGEDGVDSAPGQPPAPLSDGS